MDENEKKNNNNISVPKPVFALMIIALCATVCYSAYNAGYMKGLSATRNLHETSEMTAPDQMPEPAPSPAPDNGDGPGADSGDFFRDMIPFHPGGNENKDGGNENKNDNDNRQQGAFLDIVAATVSDEAKESYNLPSGVLIMKVSKDGAAEKAGIKVHSVITAVDAKNIAGMEDLKGFLSEKSPGDTVSVTLYEPTEEHGFEQKTISVILSDGEAVSKEN